MLRTPLLVQTANGSALPAQILRGEACRRQCMGSMKRPGYPRLDGAKPAGTDKELVVTSFEVVTLLRKPRPKRSPVRRWIRYLIGDEHASQTRS